MDIEPQALSPQPTDWLSNTVPTSLSRQFSCRAETQGQQQRISDVNSLPVTIHFRKQMYQFVIKKTILIDFPLFFFLCKSSRPVNDLKYNHKTKFHGLGKIVKVKCDNKSGRASFKYHSNRNSHPKLLEYVSWEVLYPTKILVLLKSGTDKHTLSSLSRAWSCQ